MRHPLSSQTDTPGRQTSPRVFVLFVALAPRSSLFLPSPFLSPALQPLRPDPSLFLHPINPLCIFLSTLPSLRRSLCPACKWGHACSHGSCCCSSCCLFARCFSVASAEEMTGRETQETVEKPLFPTSFPSHPHPRPRPPPQQQRSPTIPSGSLLARSSFFANVLPRRRSRGRSCSRIRPGAELFTLLRAVRDGGAGGGRGRRRLRPQAARPGVWTLLLRSVSVRGHAETKMVSRTAAASNSGLFSLLGVHAAEMSSGMAAPAVHARRVTGEPRSRLWLISCVCVLALSAMSRRQRAARSFDSLLLPCRSGARSLRPADPQTLLTPNALHG